MTANEAHANGPTRAIIAAFLANLGIALAKLVAFGFTGAASMAAEAVHSLADATNQGLLLMGARRSKRPPNEAHPFGFGRERYFWSFIVALVLFSAGGLFALFEGTQKLRHPHVLDSPAWAVGVLLVAIVLEGFSLRTALHESRELRAGGSWWRFIQRSKQPELPIVLLEDMGALLGLVFALSGVALSASTGNARWDALGSVVIGLLLVTIALVLAREMKSLLIGESASPDQVRAIRSALRSVDGIDRIIDLRTVHMSPEDLLVVSKVALDDRAQHDAVDVLNRAEAAIRDRVPQARLVYLEPD